MLLWQWDSSKYVFARLSLKEQRGSWIKTQGRTFCCCVERVSLSPENKRTGPGVQPGDAPARRKTLVEAVNVTGVSESEVIRPAPAFLYLSRVFCFCRVAQTEYMYVLLWCFNTAESTRPCSVCTADMMLHSNHWMQFCQNLFSLCYWAAAVLFSLRLYYSHSCITKWV